jgi:integrase
MKKHLTELAVERTKPPKEGSLEIFDLGYPGLALRLGHGGAKSFELFYRSNGRLRRESLGRWPAVSLSQAREQWRKTREAIGRGDNPEHREGAKTPALLVENVIEDWLKRDQGENRSLNQTVSAVKKDLLPRWSGRRIDQIKRKDIVDLLDSITDRGANAQARKMQQYVRRFFKWCLSRGILESDPNNGMEWIPACKARDRVLSDSELAKVWKAGEKAGIYGPALKLLVLTGLRREEATQLKWSEIEGNVIKLSAERMKNGDAHIVPLSSEAMEVLDSIPRIAGSDWVFTIDGKKPVNGWSKAKPIIDKESGVSAFVIHDIRRSVSTHMNELGLAEPHIIEAVLGHTVKGVAAVYNKAKHEAAKRKALEAWGQHIAKLVR